MRDAEKNGQDVSAGHCEQGWQALRGDPLPVLLGADPGLRWRALADLVKRPVDSPAVRRARSMVNAVEPVAGLLAELLPNGEWGTSTSFWRYFDGPGWRLISAVQLGADPEDPRLQAGCRNVLDRQTTDGGFAVAADCGPSPLVTARMLAVMATMGFLKHARVVEAAAWLEEADWDAGGEKAEVVAVAVLWIGEALVSNRKGLAERATESALDYLSALNGEEGGHQFHLDFPNLERIDPAEALAALARASVPFDPRMSGCLAVLQQMQDERAFWRPRSDDGASGSTPQRPVTLSAEARGGWITFEATLALLRYAVPACLPRVFPLPPAKG